MTDELFARINNESIIHIVEHDDPGEPGYVWQWFSTQKESDQVFETKESALINVINYLSFRCRESMIAFKKAKEESIRYENANEKSKEEIKFLEKLLDSKENWELIFFFWTFACTGFTGLLLGFVASFLRFQ